jgi:sugar lactone lactonase YvrE
VDSKGFVYTSDGNTEQVQKYTPKGVALDGRGFLYVCDSGNQRIQKFKLK